MPEVSISEGLGWQKILAERHSELLALRNASVNRISNEYNGRITTTQPLHDAKKLDKRITLIAREMRILDASIKKANSTTRLAGYNQDDAVLGELEDTSSE